MSRSQNLRHNVINQVINDMARGFLPSPLPSQSALAEMYNISRTTVRHILSHLCERGVLRQSGHQRQLRAGEVFSELQLARAAGVSPVVVREFLLKFSRYNLIESEKRGQWNMKKFEQSWAEQLFELREMLETHALQHFLNLPDNDARWLQAKTLLERHRALRDSIGDSFRMFSQLDRDFHSLLLSAAENIFFNQSLEIISVIFHFHYQWDESDLKQRNIIAIDEHMTILSALICHSDLDANLALRNHLNSAKQSMINSLRQSESLAY